MVVSFHQQLVYLYESNIITVQTIQKQYREIVTAIDQRRLKDAIDLLQVMARSSMRSNLIDELYNIETTYKTMLRYNLEGATDPQRDEVYLHIVSDLFRLADMVSDGLMMQSGQLFYITRKVLGETSLRDLLDDYEGRLSLLELKRINNASEAGGADMYESLLRIFNYVWTRDIDGDDQVLLLHWFDSASVSWPDKAFLVSAVWLSMANRFCPLRAALLIRLSNHAIPQVSSRARVSLMLSLFQHGNRWEISPRLTGMLATLMDQKNMHELMFQTLINIVRTRETDRIARKMNEEIFPELLKAQPLLREKLDLDNLLGDSYQEGKNPEWEDIFRDQPEFLGKLEEITKWQMEGADVFMSTFKGLKHFPFFSTAANWFLPFDVSQPLLVEALKNESDVFKSSELVKKLTDTTLLCNSDKYSLMFSIPHIPDAQKEMMTAMYGNELTQMNEIQADEQLTAPLKFEGSLANQYIQDLYRFFKVFPRHSEFEDIFNSMMDIQNRWFFKVIVPNRQRMMQLGEFFFSKDFYSDAIGIYQQLLADAPDEVAILQKLAYCHQQNSDWEQALTFYLHSDYLLDENHWNKKKIALCYLKLKKTGQALDYYLAAEKLQPTNLHTKVSIANCALELKDFEMALKYYFEVAYLEPDNWHMWRPIAWCSFVLGKFEQAERYYLKMMGQEQNKFDFLNLAHVYWCQGRRADAVAYYCKGMPLFEGHEAFRQSFMVDESYLLKHGLSSADLSLMLDQIRYLVD